MNIAHRRGTFIVFEGIDGSGKHTLANFTKDILVSKNLKVALFDYPEYDGIFGKIIDDYLYNKIELSIEEEFFAYFTDILKDQTKINRLLNEGFFVVSNRYFSSTFAFQCTKGFDQQIAQSIMDIMEIIIPDLTILVQISPSLSLERKYKEKGLLDRHERDKNLLKNVSSLYEEIIRENKLSKKWLKIDGSKSLDSVKNDIITIIDNLT